MIKIEDGKNLSKIHHTHHGDLMRLSSQMQQQDEINNNRLLGMISKHARSNSSP